MIEHVCPHCENKLFLIEEHVNQDPYCPFCWLPLNIAIEQISLYNDNEERVLELEEV